MIAEKPLIPRKRSNGAQTIRKIKLILLSFHDKFLNFKANIGNSATSNNEKIIIRSNNHTTLAFPNKKSLPPTINAPQKRALAGVGNPTKEEVCLSSTLNLASLRAEKTAIRKAR